MYPGMKEGIKEVLVCQFELHEVRHHIHEEAQKNRRAHGRGEAARTDRLEPIAHRVPDIYKCLHQGVFGVGHSIDNPQNFKERLIGEIGSARTVGAEPLLESVSPGGQVLRINLRPFRALFKGSEERGCELLLDLCIKSACLNTGLQAEFFLALEFFRELNRSGELAAGERIFSFPEDLIDAFLREVGNFTAKTGFIPVLSHSPAYKSLNNPSYRVVNSTALMRSPMAALINSIEDSETGHVH